MLDFDKQNSIVMSSYSIVEPSDETIDSRHPGRDNLDISFEFDGMIGIQPEDKELTYDQFLEIQLGRCVSSALEEIEDVGGVAEYQEEYGDGRWYYQSIAALGPEKYKQKLKAFYTAPFPGRWRRYKIDSKYFDYCEGVPKSVFVNFDQPPCIMESIYAHCKIINKFFEDNDEEMAFYGVLSISVYNNEDTLEIGFNIYG